MKKQVRIFLTAIMFLTRIRVPASVDHSPEYLGQAPRYFPVVGWIVGAVSALFYLLGSRFVSTDAGVLAAMVAGILVTGALHEDGFADVCDGFGGGWTKEKILEIMKDSRIGAYGAIGLIALLATKFILLKALPSFTPTFSRCPAIGRIRIVFAAPRRIGAPVLDRRSLECLLRSSLCDPGHLLCA